MVQDKRMDMGSIGDFNGVMGKNLGSRHQLHKESNMDRSPYYDKVCRSINRVRVNSVLRRDGAYVGLRKMVCCYGGEGVLPHSGGLLHCSLLVFIFILF